MHACMAWEYYCFFMHGIDDEPDTDCASVEAKDVVRTMYTPHTGPVGLVAAGFEVERCTTASAVLRLQARSK